MAKIIVVDDHEIFRQGICALLNQSEVDQVVADLTGVEGLDAAIKDYDPDILVMDLSLQNGMAFDKIKELRGEFPAVKVVILSMHGDQPNVDRALKAGAHCYALKKDAFQDLQFAIRAAERGGQFVSASIINNHRQSADQTTFHIEDLSVRQREILKLVQQGKSNKEIAIFLDLAVPTVKNHLSGLYQKFGVANRVELLARFGLTDFPI